MPPEQIRYQNWLATTKVFPEGMFTSPYYRNITYAELALINSNPGSDLYNVLYGTDSKLYKSMLSQGMTGVYPIPTLQDFLILESSANQPLIPLPYITPSPLVSPAPIPPAPIPPAPIPPAPIPPATGALIPFAPMLPNVVIFGLSLGALYYFYYKKNN